MSRRVRIVACQGIWTTDPDVNIGRMESFIDGISRDWGETVKLISFTEYAVCGFDPTKLAEIAESIPGPSTNRICKIAEKYKYWVCCGSMVERRGNRLYNSSLLISPKGEIEMNYSKTHPWCQPIGGEIGITPGRDFLVYDIPGIGRIGIMICYDGFFPEVARTLAWRGAELILWPTMIFHPGREAYRAIAVARAVENNCYVMAITGTGQHVGIGLAGHSMIVNPDGMILCEAGDSETILIDTIDMDYVSIARTEGAKGLLPSFRHMKLFGHEYPPYIGDFGRGAVFKQIKES